MLQYMPHIHWVERQNKLEIPKEKDEVNKREVHECEEGGCNLTLFKIYFLFCFSFYVVNLVNSGSRHV
jgi:hypothetical protein